MANKFDHDIWIQEKLAENASYCSYVAYWPEEDTKVFLKVVNSNLDSEKKKQVEERLLKEAAILEEFWSAYFPKIYDIRRKQETGELYILSEYFKGERLDLFIKRSPEKALTAQFYLHLYQELKFSLSYLHHKKKIIHFDLTPDNIIVDLDLNIRVIDFENSKVLGTSVDYQSIRAKEGYLAPELEKTIREKKEVFATSAIDIYGLGKVLKNLYEELPGSEKLKLIGKGPNLKSMLHDKPGLRSLESMRPHLNPKPIVTLLFIGLTFFAMTKAIRDPSPTKTIMKKEASRSPAIPRAKRVALKNAPIKDQISFKQSAMKKEKSPQKSFSQLFLQVISKRDKQLKECLGAFEDSKISHLKVRYHVDHVDKDRQQLAKLEILKPAKLNEDAAICLTSLYKDLQFPVHKSGNSYTIDQSFTFSPIEK